MEFVNSLQKSMNSLRDSILPVRGPIFPHVTIATNPVLKGKPYMSNQLDLSQEQAIEPIRLSGVIQEITH